MVMTESLLTVNLYSRPGWKIPKVQALVIHWTANPGQGAQGVRSYFESRKNGQNGYGSAHYVIGLKGEILKMIPEGEVGFHVGSSQPDPASGKIYTDLAREKFGIYAIDPKKSPNTVTLGIELCVIDVWGRMNPETIESAIDLSADICRRYSLHPESDLLLHKDIVGYKNCHRWYIDHPEDWKRFKEAVAARLD